MTPLATPSDLVVITGEPSGEAYGVALVEALRQHLPDIRVSGMGTRPMAAAGIDVIEDAEGLAIMGFCRFWRGYRVHSPGQALGVIDKDRRPKVVLTIDYPGFNMRLLRRLAPLRAQGTRLIHMVAPQVWAWKKRRAKSIAATVDELWCFFPFEPKYFTRYPGIQCDARFVGHPLVDLVAQPAGDEAAQLAPLQLTKRDRLLVLAPGSREKEISLLLPVFSRAVAMAQSRLRVPDGGRLVVAVAKVPDRDRDLYRKYTDYPLVDGGYRALCRAGHLGLIASGTATLEAALHGLPHVLAYKTDPLSGRLVRNLVLTDHVGLPNIVHKARLVPEILQEELNPAVLADRLVALWNEPRHGQMVQLLERTNTALGGGGAMQRMAHRLVELLAETPATEQSSLDCKPPEPVAKLPCRFLVYRVGSYGMR